jgi:hypothetical protein
VAARDARVRNIKVDDVEGIMTAPDESQQKGRPR